MGYAFISYSTKNQATADAIRNTFTANKIDTWMAPYSIPPGSKYAQSITNAIRNCSCFVLILSNASQTSEAVDSEVELAALTFKKNIVTIQIENVILNDAFTFYIHNKQILNLDRVDVSSPAMKAILSTVISFAGQTLIAPPQGTPKPSYTGASSAQGPSSPQPTGGASSAYPYGRPPQTGANQPYRPNAGTNGQQSTPYPSSAVPPYQATPASHYNISTPKQKSRIVAAILAFFLGGLGIHNFYLGKYGLGALYLVFCWTYIPAIVSLIQGIMFLCTDNQSFNMKYNK